MWIARETFVDFTWTDGQADIVVGDYAGKSFGQTAEFEPRGAWRLVDRHCPRSIRRCRRLTPLPACKNDASAPAVAMRNLT